MPCILTIEDDRLIANDIACTLRTYGFSVDIANTGREGIAKVMTGYYDVLTLDRMLPDVDGLTILATMRGVGMKTPVLVMSALSDVDERIKGLRAGGDDYLTKPFSPDEMSERIEVLLRRPRRTERQEAVLRVGSLQIDLVRHKVMHDDRELDLQPTEFRVLKFMMRNPGQVLTRTMIFEMVWGCRFDPGTNLIDMHEGHLRRKIDLPGERPIIRTMRGAGYLFG